MSAPCLHEARARSTSTSTSTGSVHAGVALFEGRLAALLGELNVPLERIVRWEYTGPNRTFETQVIDGWIDGPLD